MGVKSRHVEFDFKNYLRKVNNTEWKSFEEMELHFRKSRKIRYKIKQKLTKVDKI